MNRRLPFRRPCDAADRPKLEPDEIARAPELALLEAADAVLDSAIAALVAANPALLGAPFARDFDDTPPPPARLYAADAIVTMTQALRSAIERYRCAVDFGPADGESLE